MSAKLRVVIFVALMALLPGAALAAGGGNNGTDHFGPFVSTSPDNGSCNVTWAMDSFTRYFSVHDNGDGTFTVREDFKDGTFVTVAAPSPGACEDSPNHGTLVTAGIAGNMHGFISGTVTGGTYNAAGCSAVGADCTSTAGFISAVFGQSAAFDGADYNFEYSSSDSSLAFHHWQDSAPLPGALSDHMVGDIATE